MKMVDYCYAMIGEDTIRLCEDKEYMRGVRIGLGKKLKWYFFNYGIKMKDLDDAQVSDIQYIYIEAYISGNDDLLKSYFDFLSSVKRR